MVAAAVHRFDVNVGFKECVRAVDGYAGRNTWWLWTTSLALTCFILLTFTVT